mgnify:CR=1 FL=1|jgi:repressor LexA
MYYRTLSGYPSLRPFYGVKFGATRNTLKVDSLSFTKLLPVPTKTVLGSRLQIAVVFILFTGAGICYIIIRYAICGEVAVMRGIGETIRQLREELGLSQRALARKAGISSQYLSDIEIGRTSPSLKSLEKIASALNLPPGRLLQAPDAFYSGIVEVPVLGRVPAGGPVLADEVILGYLPLPRKLASEDTFCLEVRGNSMQDLGIDDGDFILVRVQSTAENGQVVIARIDGEVTCKRYYRLDQGICLEPANRQFRPLKVEAGEVEIVGIVTNVIKKV